MIHLHIPELPPSVNHAYMTIMKGKGMKKIPLRVLTKEGRRFKKEATSHLARTYPTELKHFKRNHPFGLAILFVFEAIQNKTWPESAKSRYKRIDVSNRVKLLEDVLADVADIDDSQHMMVILAKTEGKHAETLMWSWDIENEPNSADFALRALRGL